MRDKPAMRIVIIAALGYFVDILDLFLFSVLRVPSLKALGVPEHQLLEQGMTLLNAQMVGLLLGSFFWGVLGDKKGRVSVLYGSILLYSLATLGNAFVTDVTTYAVLRLIAGIGLAGELGLAITLVCESLPGTRRGIGTTLVAGIGLCGGIAASVLAENFSWSTCYVVGGVSGLLLLGLRIRLAESPLFKNIVDRKGRGNLKALFTRPRRLLTYVQLISVGLPIWFVSGILMIFSPEFGKELGITDSPIRASQAVLYSYIGVAIGDFASGLLSQLLRSRKQAVAIFLVLIVLGVIAYFNCHQVTSRVFYVTCFAIGIATGYWAVLITMAAESFGTDLRATVTTTVPNLIRASVVPMTFAFQSLNAHLPKLESAALVGAGCLVLAFASLYFLNETFSANLDFTEAEGNPP